MASAAVATTTTTLVSVVVAAVAVDPLCLDDRVGPDGQIIMVGGAIRTMDLHEEEEDLALCLIAVVLEWE